MSRALIILTTLILVIGSAWPAGSEAADVPPLARLSAQYYAEALAFKNVVHQVRGIDRFDERLVDRWSDETARLVTAAKNPRHFNRLFHQWKLVLKLQEQSELKIFGKYTPHHDLIGQFDRVLFAEQRFIEEFILHVENPTHVNSVRRLERPSTRRSNYLAPLTE